MSEITFYQPVSNFISVEDIPEELSFIKEGLKDLFDNILYTDLRYTKTPLGNKGIYDLTIVLNTRIDIEIPGTGIYLVLNPPPEDQVPGNQDFSLFPTSLKYNWPIIEYISSFRLSEFSFSPNAFFDLGLKIFRLSEKSLLEKSIQAFLSDEINPYDTFISRLNDYYSTAISVAPENDDRTENILNSIRNSRVGEITSVVYFLFISDPSDLNKSTQNINKLFSGLIPQNFDDYLLGLLKPEVDAVIKMGVGLEFPRNVLLPVYDDGSNGNEGDKVMMVMPAGDFYFSTTKGMGYHEEQLEISLRPKNAQIGKTGMTIGFSGVKLDLSRTSNISEADQEDRPKDFTGVFIREAKITLPEFLNNTEITGKNLLIGTGGLSGTIGLEAGSKVEATLGNVFKISLDIFSLTFRQNSIVDSFIKGTLTLIGFKDASSENTGAPEDISLDIMMQIREDGDYSITLSDDVPLKIIEIPGVLELDISNLSLGRKDGRFFIEVRGKVDFIADVPVFGKVLPKGIEIKKMLIWDNGTLEFEGGSITLPKSVSLEIGPAKFSVSAIHFGSHKQFYINKERTYSYFGFDGRLSISPGGLDARGDGIKFYYTSDCSSNGLWPDDTFLRIEGIGINLTIPGDATPETAAVILEGYLSIKTPPANNDNHALSSSNSESTEYLGAVSISLPKLNIAGSAAMKLNPDIPAFLVDINLDLPVPILLGGTGLGIHGFRGLVGKSYVPTKAAAGLEEKDTWWEYYKSKKPAPHKEGINFGKMEQKNGFSAGAGVSLSTAFDSGKVFSSKLFFMLGLPDVFLLQGQAAILKERIGLDTTTDPPFSAMIAISGQSVETAFGVNYSLPDGGDYKGKILTLQAVLEMAFFFNDAGGWYINLGREMPEDKRVRAKILGLFNGYSFLMLSSAGIKTGAGVKYDLKKSFGPVGFNLGAYLDIGGRISYKPVQIGAFIQLGGFVHLKVFGFKLGMDVAAGLAAECPDPFIITGFFKLRFGIDLFFFSVSFKINVEFTWGNTKNPNTKALDIIKIPLAEDPDEHYKVLPAAYNIMSRQTFPIAYFYSETDLPDNNAVSGKSLPVIPLDCFIDIEFLHPIKPSTHESLKKIGISENGGEYSNKIMVPPEPVKTPQVTHEFVVESIRILHWQEGTPNGSWQDYHVYEAVSAISSIADLPNVAITPSSEDENETDLNIANLQTLKAGYWQLDNPNRVNKLRILSQHMFSYQTNGLGTSLDALQFGDEQIFCEPVLRETCVNWDKHEYENLVFEANEKHIFSSLYVSSEKSTNVKQQINPYNFDL